RTQDIATCIKTDRDPKQGTFSLYAEQPGRAIRIEMRSEPEDFFPIHIPTEEAFVPKAMESFRTQTTITLYERNLFTGQMEQVDQNVIQDSALEFGGDWAKPLLPPTKNSTL
ncbi:MAG: hypothetical protein AAGJ35_10300, partial [Myxococcota bacterium]